MFSKIIRELHGIRMELKAIEGHYAGLPDAIQNMPARGADADRLEELERRFETLLGEVDAGLIRGQALKQTALAAEDRARNHAKRAEVHAKIVEELEGGEDEDSFDAVGRAYAATVPTGNDDGGHAAEQQGERVRQGLEMARAAKRLR